MGNVIPGSYGPGAAPVRTSNPSPIAAMRLAQQQAMANDIAFRQQAAAARPAPIAPAANLAAAAGAAKPLATAAGIARPMAAAAGVTRALTNPGVVNRSPQATAMLQQRAAPRMPGARPTGFGSVLR
jgi:hypothetical protein